MNFSSVTHQANEAAGKKPVLLFSQNFVEVSNRPVTEAIY